MNEDPDTGPPQAKSMLMHLKAVINEPYKDVNKPTIEDKMENIHAYMFVFDSSNKRTFDSLMCIIQTINDLEKTKRKGGGLGAGGNKKKA